MARVSLPRSIATTPVAELTPSPDIAAVGVAAPGVADAGPRREPGYRQILKATAVIGGSSLVGVAIGMVRAKAMAALLGPAGIGLMGTFAAAADLARSIAEFGINNSGVRQIAEAAATGDPQRIARTATVLRRVAIVLGLLGAAVLGLFSGWISRLSFGTDAHASMVALLGAAVFLRMVSDGQGALLQGLRRIGDLARTNVLGSALGTAIAVALVYRFGERAIVPSLIAVAAGSLAVSAWYCRRLRIGAPTLPLPVLRSEVAGLLRLGVAFMASGLLTAGAAYAVRAILVHRSGLDAAGLFQSAWALGGVYTGFVLQAMGADFYPRLVGLVNDHDGCNRAVNEQARVSMLLAAPGVLATLTLADWVLTIFYTGQFAPAAAALRWICLGMMMRVLVWPIGYIIVAKAAQGWFLATEIAWAVFYVGLTFALVPVLGIDGAGAAFFGSYLLHAALVLPIVRRMTGFGWTAENLRSIALVFVPCLAVFAGHALLPPVAAAAFGLLATVVVGLHCSRAVGRMLPPERTPRWLRPFLHRGPRR